MADRISDMIAEAGRLHQIDQLQKAEQLCRDVLAIDPRCAPALHRLGLIAFQVGQTDVAIDLMGRAISNGPAIAEYQADRGSMLAHVGRFNEAIAAFQQAIALQPQLLTPRVNLGFALLAVNQTQDATRVFRDALAIHPNHSALLQGLGRSLFAQNQLADAITSFEHRVRVDRNSATAHNDLAVALRNTNQAERAIEECRAAVYLDPKLADAHYNLGTCLSDLDRLELAIKSFHHAIAIRPNWAEAHNNLGIALRALGRLESAVDSFRRAVELKPDWPLAHHNVGLTLLLLGRYEDGFREHEWRNRLIDLDVRPQHFAQPVWNGDPLDGRRILLHAEQGFGDAIQFVRYASLVHDRGGRVIVQCQPELVALFKSIPNIEQVIPRGQLLRSFDVHCPLLTLPTLFHTTIDTIPSPTRYLSADLKSAGRWRARLAPKEFKVGLVWSGRPTHTHDRHRSIDPSLLAPLLSIPDVQWISLQKSMNEKPPFVPTSNVQWVDWTSELNDFAQSAALIENLDLVITVDTSIAHLSGSLGKPTWILLPYVAGLEMGRIR